MCAVFRNKLTIHRTSSKSVEIWCQNQWLLHKKTPSLLAAKHLQPNMLLSSSGKPRSVHKGARIHGRKS